MRILALDIGDRTIGVAASDALLCTAQGVETVRRTSLERDLARLAELCETYEADTFVLGMPRNMNGTYGPRAELVKTFAETLSARLPEVKLVFWDERLSTVAAERSLIAADVSRSKRKKVIDKMAAVFILQGYLDSKPGARLDRGPDLG